MADGYIEAEYLYDFDNHEDSYTYAWTQLGISPLEVAARRPRRPAHARVYRQRSRHSRAAVSLESQPRQGDARPLCLQSRR
ncbi:MAG: hypothetical protein M0C28_14170 [Candidatus Moduliflexus flocculans]|nr:hypothetical protein [Candidatus Moduliflexus flocculans]